MQTKTAYASPADKATDNRTFTVYEGKTLQLPILSMNDMKIVASNDAEAFVQKSIHDPEMNGMPLMNLYRGHGFILQPLNSTTAHVLVVVDEKKALEMMAMVHHTYNLLGYTLIYDETTVLLTLPPQDETDNTADQSMNSPSRDTDESDVESRVPSRQAKLDVLGMEVA